MIIKMTSSTAPRRDTSLSSPRNQSRSKSPSIIRKTVSIVSPALLNASSVMSHSLFVPL